MLFAGITLDFDVTFHLVLALLLVPFLILNGLVFRPFLKVFEERHDRIEGAMKRADAKLDEAERQAKAFETRIQGARRKGVEARDALRADAQKAMNARIDDEKTKLSGKLETALSEIQTTREQAIGTIQSEATKMAEAAAGKLLGRGV